MPKWAQSTWANLRRSDRAFVTDRALKAERSVIATMKAGIGAGRALAHEENVAAHLSGTFLTEGQQEAVQTVLLARDRIVGVQGRAGTGKTTMLREVRELAGERPIVGLAPSAAAARVLQRETDIHARTLQWFLTRCQAVDENGAASNDLGKLFGGSVLVLDEASMVSTDQMRSLMRIADKLEVARLVLVGDTAFNSEMGNCSFSEKRDAERGFRDSPLRLNADLRETERWDGDAIRARAARLADLAVDIWRRPVLTDRVLASYETPRADAGRYTIKHHPHLWPGAPMHDLFEAVRQAILALGPQVREEFRRHYVAYKTHTNFVDVVPQKRRLLLTLNKRFDELGDPRGLAADITNLGRWGNGDAQVELDNERQIPYAMELVRQAFARRQPGGAADNLSVRAVTVRS